jgi:hypothetical protein
MRHMRRSTRGNAPPKGGQKDPRQNKKWQGDLRGICRNLPKEADPAVYDSP